jgi:multidrug efflux system outer membrane protein
VTVRRAAAAALAWLAGCTLIPHYTRPALPVSASYPAGAVYGTAPAGASPIGALPVGALPAAADIGWRRFFADPALQELIGLSLQNNRDLRVDVLNVLSARATYRLDHANLFPTVEATAEGEFEREPPALTGGFGTFHINTYSLGLGVASYELDVFGRLRSLARLAREQYLSAADTRQAMQISLIAQVASTYLSWLADRETIRLSRDTAAAQQRAYDLRLLTLQHGSGTALDVAQAESSLRTAEASLAQSTRQEAQDMDEIVLLVGAPLPADLLARMQAQTDLNAQPPFPELPAGLPSDLLTRRPDVRAAEHTLLAANANVGAARAAFFPSVVLTGSGGTAAGTLGQLFAAGTASWAFQPQISVPIFDEGKNFANLDLARIEKRVEIAEYEKAIQSAFHDVADALAARTTYADQLAAEQRLVDADERYYRLSQMRFRAGVDSSLSVLVAQNALFSAQLDLVSLRLAERQNLVTLYKVLGGGWK